MTLSELNTVLLSTGLKVAYDHFPAKSKVGPPCITYNVAYTDNYSADNKVYKKISHIDIHLYTKGKDTTTEALLEQKLEGASLFWNYTESFEDSEEINHLIYEVEIDNG